MRLGAGILFLILAVVLYGAGKPKLNKEYNTYQQALVQEEGLVFLEGKLTDANKPLKGHLVLANKEEFTGAGKYSGFKPVEWFMQPLQFQTAGGDEVTLQFKEVPHRGTQVSRIMLEEKTSLGKPVQLAGVANGTRLCVVGQPSQADTVKVLYAYTGTAEEYTALLEEGGMLLNAIGGGLLLISLLFFGWHAVSRRKKSAAANV